MDNPILICESFETAANNLCHAMERFGTNTQLTSDVDRFERVVQQFSSSVDKLATVLGMQAENDHRKALGHSMAYTASDFADV